MKLLKRQYRKKFPTTPTVYFALTHRRHLRNSSSVGTIQKFWLIVIDVLNLNDELRLWLHGFISQPI